MVTSPIAIPSVPAPYSKPLAAAINGTKVKTKRRNQCRNQTMGIVGSDPGSREFFAATPQERASAGGREPICPTL
jgi:hypothetical protein